MALSYIQVPPDSTGSKVRSQTIVDGANTVHLHYYIPCIEDGTTLELTTGGQTGMKVMVVGDGDKYVRGLTGCGMESEQVTGDIAGDLFGVPMLAKQDVGGGLQELRVPKVDNSDQLFVAQSASWITEYNGTQTISVNGTVNVVVGDLPYEGQQVMNFCLPVAIASDQTTVPVAQQGAISGIVSVSGVVSVSGTVSTSGVVSVSGTVSTSGTVNVEYTSNWNKILFTNQSAVTGSIIASGGILGGWHVYSPNTDVTYLQFYGTAATITVGTTSPSMSVGIPGGAAANVEFSRGISMPSAIKVVATASPSGTTAPTQAVVLNVLYR